MLESEPALIQACDRDGWTPLHVAAAVRNRTAGGLAPGPWRRCEPARPARAHAARSGGGSEMEDRASRGVRSGGGDAAAEGAPS